jgi:hypothetical protein
MSAVLLLTGTGCPHDYMRDGFIDRAARKDAKEAQEQECPPGQTWKWDCPKKEGDDKECDWRCK